MPTIPAEAFHDRICDELSDAVAPMLDPARGGGPEFREMQRALMLADRAVRDWAPRAIGEQRPGAPNRFQQLGQLGRPEDHYHETRPAADAEVKAANSRERIS